MIYTYENGAGNTYVHDVLYNRLTYVYTRVYVYVYKYTRVKKSKSIYNFLSLNSCIVAIDLANMLPIVGQIERYGSVSDAIRIRADSRELLCTSAVRRVMPNMSS